MIPVLELADYERALKGKENESVTMELLLKPFGIKANGPKDKNLLMGLILDHLHDVFPARATIDPFDVAGAAWELGHEPAGVFLEAERETLPQLPEKVRLAS